MSKASCFDETLRNRSRRFFRLRSFSLLFIEGEKVPRPFCTRDAPLNVLPELNTPHLNLIAPCLFQMTINDPPT